MPLYSFRDEETGEEVELFRPAARSVAIGKVIRHKGRRLKRLPEKQQQLNVRYDGVFRDVQSSRKGKLASLADFRDERGIPCWKSRDRARDAAKRATDAGLATTFDD